MNDKEEPGWLCSDCVVDYYLSIRIDNEGETNTCRFCQQSRPCLPVATVADLIHVMFSTRCTRDDEQGRGQTPLFWISTFLGHHDERSDRVAEAILDCLSETYDNDNDSSTYYGNDAYYISELPYSGTYITKWNEFRRSLLHESRYFNPAAKQILDEIFDGLNFDTKKSAKAHLPYYMLDQPVVTLIDGKRRKSILYRAREARHAAIAAEYLKDPTKHLGPPPPDKARAGRMNPAGVSMFYGALEPKTCVSEIRAPVGTYVVTGEFKVLRPLRLLDFRKLREATERIPHFHPKYMEKKERDLFLGEFCFEIATPVHPHDEAFGYLPTQAVAEYLAQREDLELDGLLFPSTQTGSKGTNVVLFRSASIVEPSEERFDVAYLDTVDLGYGLTSHFDITTKPEVAEIEDGFGSFLKEVAPDTLPPKPTLRLMIDRIAVSKVESISFRQAQAHLSRSEHTDKPEEEF